MSKIEYNEGTIFLIGPNTPKGAISILAERGHFYFGGTTTIKLIEKNQILRYNRRKYNAVKEISLN